MDREETILSIHDLKMSYADHEVLKGIDLEVFRGQIIGYIGPNGAGKSTTIKLMLGLETGYTGTIRVFGQDISDGRVEYKRKIGYVPESGDIYESLTSEEYLTFIGCLYGLREDQTASRAQALVAAFGLEEAYRARISSYSKGMRQKVLLISSLIHNPEILFLDEPLSGLDANSVMVVKDVLAKLSQAGKTIFYSSHIMEVVEKISDRIILLNQGRIVADGNFEELKHDSREQSLEGIFGEITGFFEHGEIAERVVSIIDEVP